MGLKRTPPEGNARRGRSFGGNNIGNLTNKANRIVQFESLNEYAFILKFLEKNRLVKDYGSQPETFYFIGSDGKQHHYTPDFIAWMCDSSVWIYEVTILKRRDQETNRNREAAARMICPVEGKQFASFDERHIPKGAELANLELQFVYRPSIYSNARVASAVDDYLNHTPKANLRKLIADLFESLNLEQSVVVPALLHMLWHEQLQTDMQKLLFIHSEPAPYAFVWK